MSERTPATIPPIIYGTAWKKDATTELVTTAVKAGFTGIDTANQPKHYQEPLVGTALQALAASGTDRTSLFLQTKFTPINGQDHRVPYNPQSTLANQVRESFESSLNHLKTEYLDSYLLHGPYSYPGLGESDWEVWHALEQIYTSGRARLIGISNINAFQLATLIDRSEIRPMVVQNRCYANRGWDREVRQLCRAQGVIYQGFSLLTANPYVLRHPSVLSTANRLGVHAEQVIFRFAMQAGIVPLTGTTDVGHMKEDLTVTGIQLTPEEVDFIETIEE